MLSAGDVVRARIAALPSPSTCGRLLLHAPLDPRSLRAATQRAQRDGKGAGSKAQQAHQQPKAGEVVTAVVQALHDVHAEVSLEGWPGCRGRLHICEAGATWGRIQQGGTVEVRHGGRLVVCGHRMALILERTQQLQPLNLMCCQGADPSSHRHMVCSSSVSSAQRGRVGAGRRAQGLLRVELMRRVPLLYLQMQKAQRCQRGPVLLQVVVLGRIGSQEARRLGMTEVSAREEVLAGARASPPSPPPKPLLYTSVRRGQQLSGFVQVRRLHPGCVPATARRGVRGLVPIRGQPLRLFGPAVPASAPSHLLELGQKRREGSCLWLCLSAGGGGRQRVVRV